MNFELTKNLAQVKQRIARAAREAGKDPGRITLVAVSKLATAKAVGVAADLGQKDFGENRVQGGLKKISEVGRDDLRWHLIGRIQTNKIKSISPFFLIHSLDRWRLAQKMSDHALDEGFTFQCLLQVNVAADANKAGIGLGEIDDFLEGVADLGGIDIKGLMTITAFGVEGKQTRAWFDELANKYHALSKRRLPDNVRMHWLSMGMSADFELAVAAGANMVRVGNAIFAGGGCHT